MQNQMDWLIEASEYQYEQYCEETNRLIENYIKENRYTWTVEDIFNEYRNKYCKNYYVSFTANKIIKEFEERLIKITGIKK